MTGLSVRRRDAGGPSGQFPDVPASLSQFSDEQIHSAAGYDPPGGGSELSPPCFGLASARSGLGGIVKVTHRLSTRHRDLPARRPSRPRATSPICGSTAPRIDPRDLVPIFVESAARDALAQKPMLPEHDTRAS